MRVTRPLGRFCACFTILVMATGMIATLHQRLILSIVSEHEYFRILFIRKTFLLYFAKINTFQNFSTSEELIFLSLISILHYSIKNFFKNITKKKALQAFFIFQIVYHHHLFIQWNSTRMSLCWKRLCRNPYFQFAGTSNPTIYITPW